MRSMRQLNRQYFEATIQLRPDNKELVQFVKKQLQKHPDVFISQEIHKKYGTDLYVSSRKFATLVGKRLKQSFKGKIILSRKLFSRDRHSGKAIYRVTVCFRQEEQKETPKVL